MTCDELWRHLPGADADSVHLADFPVDPESLVDRDLVARWDRLLGLRDAVNGELEKLRQDKVVGTSLEAAVTLTADGGLAELLEAHRDDLATLFITSAVTLRNGAPGGDEDGRRCTATETAAHASRSAAPTGPSARGAGAG